MLGLRKFLQERVAPKKPLLIGYSGGPDSKALLHLLLQCRRFFSLNLHLAHVDHGWREESHREAALLAEESGHLNLPFHLQVIDSKSFTKKNLEEQGRNFRHQFFSSLYEELGCQALVLGHHADDQAEVVLKRVCEGASLFSMRGLGSESELLGMQIWRPLLHTPKKGILDWLSQKGISYFQDPTNRSTRFLRGRMREEMIPALEASFGKRIASNLCLLGEESREIREYFSTLNTPILELIKADGTLDLNPFLPMPALQLKYLLKEWARGKQVTFSKEIFDLLVAAILSRLSNKKFLSNQGTFLVEKGVVSFSV